MSIYLTNIKIILFGFVTCRNCGDFGPGVCHGAGNKILYEWSRNAPKLELPPSKSIQFSLQTNRFLYVKYKLILSPR